MNASGFGTARKNDRLGWSVALGRGITRLDSENVSKVTGIFSEMGILSAAIDLADVSERRSFMDTLEKASYRHCVFTR